jgi:hypothetical protein
MNRKGPAINPQDVEELWRSRLAAKAGYEIAAPRLPVFPGKPRNGAFRFRGFGA